MQTLSSEQSHLLFESTAIIASFPMDIQTVVRSVFGQAFNLQMKIMLGFATAQIPATLLMWQRKPLRVT